MKKKIFIFILFLFVFSDIFSNALDEDCAYLGTLLSDVAIDMSLALEEKNLTSKDVINDIKSIYKKTASKKLNSIKKLLQVQLAKVMQNILMQMDMFLF